MARIVHYPGRVELETPYNPLFVDEMHNIPSRSRKWEPDRKVWTVWEPYVDQAVRITKTLFPNATEVGQKTRKESSDSWKRAYEGSSSRQEGRYTRWEDTTWHSGDYETPHERAYRREQEEARRHEQERRRRERRATGWDYDGIGSAFSQKRRRAYSDGTFGPWEDNPDWIGRRRTGHQSGSTGSGHAGTFHHGSSDHQTLFVTPDAPETVVRAAYKALAIYYHPDRNPGQDTTRKMQDVNGAFARIKKLKGWK